MRNSPDLLKIKSSDGFTHVLLKQIVGEYLEKEGYEVNYEKTFFLEKLPVNNRYLDSYEFDLNFAPLFYSLEKETRERIGRRNHDQITLGFKTIVNHVYKRNRVDVIGEKLKERFFIECNTNIDNMWKLKRNQEIWGELGKFIVAVKAGTKYEDIERYLLELPNAGLWLVDFIYRTVHEIPEEFLLTIK